MALSAVTHASDPPTQAQANTAHATQTTRQQTHYDATKAFATAVVTHCAAVNDALNQCMRCHPQATGQAALEAANAALATAAAALVTATTT